MNSAIQNVSPGLIHQAQLGNQESMDRLAELVRDRLSAYIYRLTLDYALTQDLLQETILFMIQSLNQLEHVDNFWPWLYRTALGKIQHHFRQLQRLKETELTEDERLRIHHRVARDFNDGLSELLRKEISDAVFKAMKRLKIQYRNILILRCFENLEYAEIASLMNCSEIRTRVLFFRAKNSLRRHLAFQGFGKHYFLIALALFGVVTTSAKASTCTITAASLNVGFTASFLAAITSKFGMISTACIAAAALTIPFDMIIYAIPIICLAAFTLFFISILSIYS